MRWRCGRQRDDGNYQSITCMNSHPMNHSQAARAPSCHSVVQNVNSARDLGAQPDSELSVQDRQHNTCYHLRKLYQFRSYVSQAVTIQLLMSLAMTNIDYCNSVLAGLLASTLAPLQCVQNSTARLILGLDQRPHITPASCKTLHRLPVKYRVSLRSCITFSIAVLHRTSVISLHVAFVVDQICRCSSNNNSVRQTCIVRLNWTSRTVFHGTTGVNTH